MWRHGKRNEHRNAQVHDNSVTVNGPSDDCTSTPSPGNRMVSRLAICDRTRSNACGVKSAWYCRSSSVTLAASCVDLLTLAMMLEWSRSPRRTCKTQKKFAKTLSREANREHTLLIFPLRLSRRLFVCSPSVKCFALKHDTHSFLIGSQLRWK